MTESGGSVRSLRGHASGSSSSPASLSRRSLQPPSDGPLDDLPQRRKSGPLVHYSNVNVPTKSASSPAVVPKAGVKEIEASEKVLFSHSLGGGSWNTSPLDDSNQSSLRSIAIPNNEHAKREFERDVYDIRSLLFLLFVTGFLGMCIGVGGGLFHKVVFEARNTIRVTIGAPLYEVSPYLMYAGMTISCILSAVTVGIITQKLCPECIGGGMIATRICVSLGAPLRFEVVLYRFALSSLYMGGGNPLGAEAPTLHICAALAGSINGFFSKIFPSLLSLETMPQIVLIGCVAGLSQAFHTPIGALIFALEEFDFVRRSHVTFVLISACAVSATLVSSALKDLSSANAALFSIPPPRKLDQMSFGVLFIMSTVIGICMAVLAELFNRLVMKSRGRMEAFIHSCNSVGSSVRRNAAVVASAALLVGVSGVVIIEILDKVVGIKCSAHERACPDSWGVGEMTMTAFSRFLAFSASTAEDIESLGACKKYGDNSYWYYPDTWDRPEDLRTAVIGTFIGMLLVGAIKLVIVALAAAAGGSGGMFAPALTLGGLLGGGIGLMLCFILESWKVIDEVHLEVMGHLSFTFGMVGFFTSTHRLPLTASICVFELTTYAESENCVLRMPTQLLVNRILFPCFWTSVVSFSLSLYFDPDSLLERMIEQDGFTRDDVSEVDDSVSSAEEHLQSESTLDNQSITSFAPPSVSRLSRNSNTSDFLYNPTKKVSTSAHGSFISKLLSQARKQRKRMHNTILSLPNVPDKDSSVGVSIVTDESFGGPGVVARRSIDGERIDEEKDEWAGATCETPPSRSGSWVGKVQTKELEKTSSAIWTTMSDSNTPTIPKSSSCASFLGSLNTPSKKGNATVFNDSRQDFKRTASASNNSNTSTMRIYMNAVQNKRCPNTLQNRSNSVTGYPQKEQAKVSPVLNDDDSPAPKSSRSLNAYSGVLPDSYADAYSS
eukprot:GEMP01001778.1.p1 GENE.GEMP01001778.1~~GEMP01001778.1.p1  ORF type:complete len:949 (+),score=157.28 GEMP01001778.1:343-3189(+)